MREIERRKLHLLFISCCFVASFLFSSIVTAQSLADSQSNYPSKWQESDHFQLVQLAEGVWAAAHKDEGHAISNAGIVDLGERTLIFDTFLTPKAAADLREAAESLTGRPAELVVNSHFHNDHIRGNQEFLPEAEIISTPFTRNTISENEPEQIAAEKEQVPGFLAELSERLKNAPSEERAELRMWRGYYEGIIQSHSTLVTTEPTATFESTLSIHGSKRKVELKALGRGHTKNDVVLYLPGEQIAFMGDLLFVERHPWLGDGFSQEWVEKLRLVDEWSVDIVVPGHGPVSEPRSIITMAEYIETLTKLVRTHAEAGASLEEVISLPIPEPYKNWWYGRFYTENLRHLYMTMDSAELPEHE